MVNELPLASFIIPPGWAPLPIDRERPALYRLTRRGNLEVAVDLSREVRGARGAAETVAFPEEGAGGLAGTLPEEYARVVVPSRPGPEVITPPLRELEPRPVVTIPTGYRRREFGVALVAAEAVEAYRSYLARLPVDRRSQRDFLHGAAYAVYTSYLQAPVLGFFVQSLATGGLEHGIPEAPVTGGGLRPSQVPEEAFQLPSPRGSQRAPVFYQTVAALIYAVNGPNAFRLDLADFDHMMYDIGWTPCGRIPRSNLYEWCPPMRAASIVPELPPQTQLVPGAPPVVYPVHAPPARPTPMRVVSLTGERRQHVPGAQAKRLSEDRSFRRAVIERAKKRRHPK
jgi:hypothetical protein